MLRSRTFYKYSWIAGNNRPTVYGNYLAEDEEVDLTAAGYVSAGRGQNAMRGGARVFTGEIDCGDINQGGVSRWRRVEANVNPYSNCANQPMPNDESGSFGGYLQTVGGFGPLGNRGSSCSTPLFVETCP